MNLKEAIVNRRSIRKFQDREVDDKIIREILEYAMFAPSAKDEQPWHFIVIKNRETLNLIAEKHPYAKMLKSAPLAIAVCGELKSENQQRYWMLDCSLATQNLMLGAYEKGLGSVWVSIYPREERVELLRETLSLPSDVMPLALIPIGYPDESKKTPQRFKEEKIHLEKF